MTENHVFTYDVAINGDSHTLTFKSLGKIPAGILRRARNDPESQLWAPFEWALSEDDLAILDEMPADELPQVLKAWQDHSEVELGELSKSPSSSTATASGGKRSKRTLSH